MLCNKNKIQEKPVKRHTMKRYSGLISLLIFGLSISYAAEFSIKSGNGFLYKSFSSPGQNGDVFIFSGNMDDVSIEFSVEDPTGFAWYEYNIDPANAVKLTENTDYVVATDNKSSILNNIKGNYGYYVEYEEQGECETTNTCAKKKFMWTTAYAAIDSVKWDTTNLICNNLQLQISPSMEYILADNAGYKSTGLIQRELNIVYYTFKEENHIADVYEISDDQEASTVLNIDTIPCINTNFTITDKFGEKLGLDSAVYVYVTDTFKTSAVIAFPSMSVTNKEKNELDPDENWETDDLGNVIVYFSETLNSESVTKFRTSAPLYVDFVSNASPMTQRYEWHFSRDENFTTDFTYYEKDLNSFPFTEAGVYYIKLVVQSKDSISSAILCDYTTYACLNISDSEILIPNVFTPNGDGMNDEFKVAYKSILSYRCRIYNQWGRKVYDSTDISKGWDGTIGGTHASIGTYFYIIEAKGNDGKLIKKQGDINLVRSR